MLLVLCVYLGYSSGQVQRDMRPPSRPCFKFSGNFHLLGVTHLFMETISIKHTLQMCETSFETGLTFIVRVPPDAKVHLCAFPLTPPSFAQPLPQQR